MASILAATQSLNAAMEFAKKFREMNSNHAADELVSNLLSEIVDAKMHAIEAHTELDKMANRVRGLDTELREIKDFRSELKSYSLQKIGETAFVYVSPDSEGGGETRHWLCAACCQSDRKSILQFRRMGVGRLESHKAVWACPACSTEILIPRNLGP